MIAHVAETGENRGRVVLQLGSAHPSAIALEAAVRIARAFQSEIESVFVEDEQLFDCAAYGFVREVSLTGRVSRAVSAAGMTQDLRLAAQGARRQLEALARLAEVPLRSRVVRDEPLRALAIACAETGPWNVLALAEPFAGGNAGLVKQLLVEISGTTGIVMVGPRARRVTGPTVIAVEDADTLPSLLRAAERLTALDGTQIVLLLIAHDDEVLDRMDGQARLVVEAREDVRIERAAMARGEAAVVAEALRRLRRRLRHLPVRRSGGARRGQPQAAGLRARVSAVPGAVGRAAVVGGPALAVTHNTRNDWRCGLSIRCRCSDRSNLGKSLDRVLVVPAAGGFPCGPRLRGDVVRLVVETASVVGHHQVEVGDICNLPSQGPLRPATIAGVFILLVREGSPASSAGVKQDDIVISIDDRSVASAEELVCAIAMHAPGNLVRLAIVRSGELRVAVVNLTRWPNDMLPAPPACSAPVS